MELLYIGKNTAYQLLNEGQIKAFRIGNTWKIPKAAVEEYIIGKCKVGEEWRWQDMNNVIPNATIVAEGIG